MKIEPMYRKITINISQLDKVIKELSKNSKVKAIYLFGSYARGDSHNLSDIDLCIMSQEKIYYYDYDNLEVVNFDSLPLIIQFRVFKEGKALFIRDSKYVNNLKSKTLKEYIEFLPTLNRYVEMKLNV